MIGSPLIPRPPRVAASPTLPGEPLPGLTFSVWFCRVVGFIALVVPPTRSVISVIGDLLQMLVLLAAALVPIWLLVTSLDPGGEGMFNKDATDKITGVLEKMRRQLIGLLECYFTAFLLLIAAKLICTWCEPHLARLGPRLIARLVSGLAGGALGEAYVRTKVAISIQGHVQFLRGMAAAIRHMRR